MVWKIAKKELLLNLMTFKFLVGTILCVVLTAVFMPVLLNDYQQRLKDYNANVAANEAELYNAKVYLNISSFRGLDIYRPPTVLSVFSKGVENQLSNSTRIKHNQVPEISARLIEVNPYLSILPALDISLIFKIVISALTLLVASDVISGDRERGTLKLILSGTVARYKVLLGKLLAGLMTLFVPLTIAFLVGLLIFLFSAMVDLTTSDWARIGLMYLVSLIFISAIYNIGLFVSCVTKRSAISLMLGLFLWVVFILVVPNESIYLATKIRPLEPEEKVESQLKLIEEKRLNEREKVKVPWKGEEIDHSEGYWTWYVLVCDKKAMETRRKRFAMSHPIDIKYADKAWEIEHFYVQTLFEQKKLADSFSRISPIFLYENVMSALAGTDAFSFQYFIDRARAYRNEVIRYVRNKTDNFSSPLYFTQCSEADMMVYQQYLDGKMPEDDFQKWKEKKIAQIQSLDLPDFPRFTYRPNIVEDFQKIITNLSVLVFINVLFFTLSFLVFVKYDVR